MGILLLGYPVLYSFNILKGQQGQKLSPGSIILAARERENFRRAEEGLNFEIFQKFLIISSNWPIPQIFYTQESCFKHMSKIWDSLMSIYYKGCVYITKDEYTLQRMSIYYKGWVYITKDEYILQRMSIHYKGWVYITNDVYILQRMSIYYKGCVYITKDAYILQRMSIHYKGWVYITKDVYILQRMSIWAYFKIVFSLRRDIFHGFLPINTFP